MTAGRAAWAAGRRSPCSLGLEYPVILSGKSVSRRGVCFPDTSQKAMPGLRVQATLRGTVGVKPCSPLLGGRDPPLSPALSSQTGLRKKDTAAFQTVLHREDEDRHLMLTKISNKEVGLTESLLTAPYTTPSFCLAEKLYVHKNTNTQFVEQSGFNIFIYIYIYTSGRFII